ncbi:MAG: alkaline phosphatase family protein [Burkholderiaceae bacterium]
MNPIGYGEDQPSVTDDRLPVVLVILDGLGDRAIPELGGRTPSEAANTPVLDSLTRRGASGWHVPFGWGRAPSSEVAHWAMFGYADVPFPGRAILEGIGAGLDLPFGVATTFAALRTSQEVDGRLRITGRATPDDKADVASLLAELEPVLAKHAVQLHPLGQGEALLLFTDHANANVTDSDPFFESLHPWLRVRAIDPSANELADAMNTVLLEVRDVLRGSAVNRSRGSANKPALDVLTTKWTGARVPIPDFIEQTGVAGAAVTSTRMYRGIAGVLGMAQLHVSPRTGDVVDHAADFAQRIAVACQLIDDGARFVHVHIKATDEAGHTKEPRAKLKVLEALDPGLAELEALAGRAIVAITGDHASPSVDGVLHTADPTPLLLVGPTVRADAVVEFGERQMREGWFGVVHARELLPLLFSHANRPAFMGHRITPRQTPALSDNPEAMPLA